MPEPLDVHQALFVALYGQAIERAYRAADAVHRDHPSLAIVVDSDLTVKDLESGAWGELGLFEIRFEVTGPESPGITPGTKFVRCFADATVSAMERTLRHGVEGIVLAIATADAEEDKQLEEMRRRLEELVGGMKDE